MRRKNFDKEDWVYDYGKGTYIHKNGTEYDDDGFDYDGYDKDGYNELGFNKHKKHRNGTFFDDNGYDIDGYDKNGYNIRGFKRVKYHSNLFIHKNGTKYDDDGFDYDGYNKDGYDREGYNKSGFNGEGFHKNGSRYDDSGFDIDGYDIAGYNKNGFNTKGFHRNGTEYDDNGRDKDGYNKEGYDYNGFDREGFNVFTGLNKKGLTRQQVEEGKKQKRANYFGLMNNVKKLTKGEMTIEEYIMHSKTSIDDLITFAKKQEMDANTIRSLYKYKKPYNAYKKPFSKKEYLGSVILMIEGKEVSPTEKDVDKCVDFLKVRGSLICYKTVSDTVRKYLRGEIDITIKEKDLQQQIQENETIIVENEKAIKENLVDILTAEQKKIKSQEAEISDLKSQRRDK